MDNFIVQLVQLVTLLLTNRVLKIVRATQIVIKQTFLYVIQQTADVEDAKQTQSAQMLDKKDVLILLITIIKINLEVAKYVFQIHIVLIITAH